MLKKNEPETWSSAGNISKEVETYLRIKSGKLKLNWKQKRRNWKPAGTIQKVETQLKTETGNWKLAENRRKEVESHLKIKIKQVEAQLETET